MCSRLFLLPLAAILIFSVSAQMRKSGPATNDNSQRIRWIEEQKQNLARQVEMSISDQKKAEAAIADVERKLTQQADNRKAKENYSRQLESAKQQLRDTKAQLQALRPQQRVLDPVLQLEKQNYETKQRRFEDCQTTLEAQLRLLDNALKQGGDLEGGKRKLKIDLECLKWHQRQTETKLQNLDRELDNLKRQK